MARFGAALVLLATWLLSGCVATAPAPSAPGPAAALGPGSAPTSVPALSAEPAASPTPAPTVTPSPVPTPTLTPTPDPYAGLTIADLRARSYGEGEVTIEETVGANEAFTRHYVRYPSDGLRVHGFMNVPHGEGPFPVAVVLHGYIDPGAYHTLAYTTRYADALARAGYLVLHPNLRGYPPSDEGPNRFRVGMAVDVLNLIGIVRRRAGLKGPLAAADPERIGTMRHSMGGGIAIRVVTVDRGVRAAVLYAAMNADERLNHEKVVEWSGGRRGLEELGVPEEDLARISPASYLGDVTAAIAIHHGTADGTVPVAWSEDLYRLLTELGVEAEYHAYPGGPHTLRGENDTLFIERMIAFLDEHLGRAP